MFELISTTDARIQVKRAQNNWRFYLRSQVPGEHDEVVQSQVMSLRRSMPTAIQGAIDMEPGTQPDASFELSKDDIESPDCSNCAIVSTNEINGRLGDEQQLAERTAAKQTQSLCSKVIQRHQIFFARPLPLGSNGVRFGLSTKRKWKPHKD